MQLGFRIKPLMNRKRVQVGSIEQRLAFSLTTLCSESQESELQSTRPPGTKRKRHLQNVTPDIQDKANQVTKRAKGTVRRIITKTPAEKDKELKENQTEG
jgi:hypothetical protein